MNTPKRGRSPTPDPVRELALLRNRLAEAESTLTAIRSGEVDALVVAGQAGPQVFTLEGADHAYRVLIESMNEGALTLTADAAVLYANQGFARMVDCPLEQVTGSSFRRFLTTEDQAALQPLLKRAGKVGAKLQVNLNTGSGSRMPVQLSIRPLPRKDSSGATIGLVVTDLTEARRNEELLRALTHRVVQVQEAERGRVALELHDHITQLLCAILVRSQTLADQLPAREATAKREAGQLAGLLGEAADEVERISRNLRPGVLEHLGLIAALREISTQFAEQAGVPVKLTAGIASRLPDDIELTIYRILQEALRNSAKHACAHHVTVNLNTTDGFVKLVIADDGIGFDPNSNRAGVKQKGRLGLVGMRERAAYVGGTLRINSHRRAGTEIEVLIPLPAGSTRRRPKPTSAGRDQ